ncbi:hypothetical protein AVEN_252698-1 [Araneus ventricosus]|uniref:Integrase catalytic domain-containing protein n=1 Tax=Araneus ventricosus TaxID=182803 RepID=A0A4Y2GNR4_ARAVE|nr:hypothetical protein AVEN_252698-1 [Araneus ventricosus]
MLHGNLFKADIEPIVSEKGAEVHTVMEDSFLLQLYHERWGHQDKRHIKDMLQKELRISVHLDKKKPANHASMGKHNGYHLEPGRKLKVLLNWFQQIPEGITQRLTAPYTPEQNGASEREMRIIIEMARTFKYSNPDVNYPAAMWAELITTAVYVLNRTGQLSVEEGASPNELWMKK